MELVKAWVGVGGCSSCHLVHFQKSFTFLHPKVPGGARGGGGGGGLWSGSLSRPQPSLKDDLRGTAKAGVREVVGEGEVVVGRVLPSSS